MTSDRKQRTGDAEALRCFITPTLNREEQIKPESFSWQLEQSLEIQIYSSFYICVTAGFRVMVAVHAKH